MYGRNVEFITNPHSYTSSPLWYQNTLRCHCSRRSELLTSMHGGVALLQIKYYKIIKLCTVIRLYIASLKWHGSMVTIVSHLQGPESSVSILFKLISTSDDLWRLLPGRNVIASTQAMAMIQRGLLSKKGLFSLCSRPLTNKSSKSTNSPIKN